MIKLYISFFTNGDINIHKELSKIWVRNKDPIIETYIGFIENYMDPLKCRAFFEGWVTIVNKKRSKKFNNLVKNSTKFIPYLPWPKEFEKDQFLKPDFS